MADDMRRKVSTENGIPIKRVKLTLNEADDVNIDRIDPLIPPQILMEDCPASKGMSRLASGDAL